MAVRVDLYHDTDKRTLFTSYLLEANCISPEVRLLLRMVPTKVAQNFMQIVYATYPNFSDGKYFPVKHEVLVKMYNDLYGAKLSVKKVHVPKRAEVILVEKFIGDTILPGSRFYCGCCGEPVARSVQEIISPFDALVWIASTREYAYTINDQTFICDHCDANLFTDHTPWSFMGLEEYFEWIQKAQIQNLS